MIVALVADLIFGSRIRAAAEQAGKPLRLVRRVDDAREAADDAELLLLDLNLDPDATFALVRELQGRDARRRVVGFYSHVDRHIAEAAGAAGIEALTRSKFVRELPALLRGDEAD